eukprot:scaffold55918_cov35-Tisochrysis_lutea.AAC.5
MDEKGRSKTSRVRSIAFGRTSRRASPVALNAPRLPTHSAPPSRRDRTDGLECGAHRAPTHTV